MSTICSSPIPIFYNQEVGSESLEQKLQRGALTIDEVVALAETLASELDAQHAQGHQDGFLTPSRIMFTSSSQIHRRPVASASLHNTKAYMAPEAWEGSLVNASDQFSLAAILYEALCGGRVFPGDNDASVHHSITTGRFVPLAARVPGLADAVDCVFERALSKKPSERYANCKAFASDLTYAIIHSQANVSSLETPQIPQIKPWFSRLSFLKPRRVWAPLWVVSLLFVLLLVLIASSAQSQ